MNDIEWQKISVFREDFKAACRQWLNQCGYEYASPQEALSSVQKSIGTGKLHLLQHSAAVKNGTPDYVQETPIVYNHTLDDITAHDVIKLIIVSDNPGKTEQLHKNQRYLMGQAGKVAEGFFRRNPELAIDFRQSVIILNKTPIHTAKTKELHYLLTHGGRQFQNLFEETQHWLALHTAALQHELGCPLWLVGYSELKTKSLFTPYAQELKRQYSSVSDAPVFVFQHFSMNCFANDLKKHQDGHKTLLENLRKLGLQHRAEVLGW